MKGGTLRLFGATARRYAGKNPLAGIRKKKDTPQVAGVPEDISFREKRGKTMR